MAVALAGREAYHVAGGGALGALEAHDDGFILLHRGILAHGVTVGQGVGAQGFHNVHGDADIAVRVEEQILALTVEDVNKAIRRFADPENLTIVLAGDREKAKEAGKDFFAK